MDTRADDDTINLHDLQAQIDLSMSFAQNLVMSWVKPTHYAQTNKQRELEDEIKEFMRRPARLGVGAPIPEAQSLNRETARLKSRLVGGKKRPRTDDGVDVKTFQSDDEEESRTGAIKKRARLDPFSTLSKKYKRDAGDNGKSGSGVHPAAMRATSQNQSSAADRIEVDEVAKELLTVPHAPENSKKSGPSLPVDHNHIEEKQTETFPLFHVQTTPPSAGKLLVVPKSSILSQPPAQSTSESPSLLSTVPPISHRNLADPPLTFDLTPSSGDRLVDTSFLQQPLLNLRGSPSEPENENSLAPVAGLTQKKKRKRRKKRKSERSTRLEN